MTERKPGPRPVVLGTCTLAPFEVPLAERLADGLALVDEMARRAEAKGWPLDLVLLPEHFGHGGPGTAQEKAEPIDGRVMTALREKARAQRCNIAASVLLSEAGRVTNAVVFIDREGQEVGRYEKLHPVLHLNGTIEEGVTPGRDAGIVDLDIGRVGAQVCMDCFYDDGWQALDDAGAELVVFTSATSAVGALRSHAWRHEYYILASTFRPPTIIVNPLGREIARTDANKQVLVERVDLDYRVLPWNSLRDFGEALGRKYGERIRQDWDLEQDLCLLTSRDELLPVGELLKLESLETHREHLSRNLVQQDRERGGPPPK